MKIECVTTNFRLHKSGGVCVCRPSSSIIFVIAWLSEGLIIRCSKNILITVLQPWKYEPVCTKEAQLIVQNTTFEGADIMSQSLTVSPYNINTRSRGHNTYAICIYISKQLLIVHVNMRPLYVLSWSAWSGTRCWRAQWRYHSSHWKGHRTRVTRLVWYTKVLILFGLLSLMQIPGRRRPRGRSIHSWTEFDLVQASARNTSCKWCKRVVLRLRFESRSSKIRAGSGQKCPNWAEGYWSANSVEDLTMEGGKTRDLARCKMKKTALVHIQIRILFIV